MSDWKTTNEVIDAVRDGLFCSEEELRYAVRNLSIWQNGVMFPLARAIVETPMSDSTKRDLQRCWDNARDGNKVPLDVRLRGGSFEPGISEQERTERFVNHTTDTAMKLVGALDALKNEASEP